MITTTKNRRRRWIVFLLKSASQPDWRILFCRQRCSCRSPGCWCSWGPDGSADCERLVYRLSVRCALARAATNTVDCPGSGSRKSTPCLRPRLSLRARSPWTGGTVSPTLSAYLSKSSRSIRALCLQQECSEEARKEKEADSGQRKTRTSVECA